MFALGCNAAVLSARAAIGSTRALSAQAPPTAPAARFAMPTTATMKRKKWEHKEVHAITGKPILQKLHVHTGDQVIVIAGANKGVISEVTYVNRATGQIGVKDVELDASAATKFRADGAQQRQESKFQACQVSPVTKDGKPSRIRHQMVDGKKRRVLVKSGEVMPL